LLQSGDFETALSTIEEGIAWTKQQLSVHQTTNVEDVNSLHESMAPFHYLYGTTLLYSIEESTDGLQPLTTVETGATSAVEPEDDEEEDDDAQEYEGMNTSSNFYANEMAPEAEEPQGDNVEDMEIAWENLDTARTILEQMLLLHPKSDKLRADMAQILLREGDLQRQNGAYTAAVTDYTSCLSYYENNTLIPPYCRKIADVHCNLGAVYFNLVVETKKGPNPPEANENVTEIQERDRPAKIVFYRNRGFYHYYECAKTLVGIIGELFQTKPYELFQRVEDDHSAQFFYCNERSDDYPKLIRSKLTSIRQLITNLTKTNSSSTTVELSIEDSDLIQDSLAVLEEIQETIDEAETSEQGVVEATAMKEEITALVASQQQHDDNDGKDTNKTCSNAFGSAAAAASTAVAQPINMIVKKKKKRTEEELIDENGMDVKLPAKDNGNSKRIKSNE
jgi:tetratricopeptide (TPR) repeat protein